MARGGELKTEQGAWRKADVSGAGYEGFGTIPEGRQTSVEFRTAATAQTGATVGAPDHRWDSPRYEIALQGGYLYYPTRQLEGVAVLLTSPNPELPPQAIGLFDNIWVWRLPSDTGALPWASETRVTGVPLPDSSPAGSTHSGEHVLKHRFDE